MAHNNYYLDLTAETYVVHDGAVLLRLHEKYKMWIAPGGHIDAGEDANEAALRELFEEAGVRAMLIGPADWQQEDTANNRDLVPPIYLNRHRISDTHEHSSFVFAAVTDSRELAPQPGEHPDAELRWVNREELLDMKNNDDRLQPETYRYALKALDLVG